MDLDYFEKDNKNYKNGQQNIGDSLIVLRLIDFDYNENDRV